MEDLTVWKVGDASLVLDISDADTAAKYERAIKLLTENIPKDLEFGTEKYIRGYCKAFRDMYKTLFDDDAEKIFDGIEENIRKYNNIYGEFLAFISAQSAAVIAEMMEIRNKYMPKGR